MRDNYFTIEKRSEGFLKEKASKFYAIALPVKSVDAVKDSLELIKKEYYDARHHCYAYRIGSRAEVYRANDDGEPSNSAGKPILGQLESFDVTNCLLVVVRYFGGTKLGVGGLIQAYKESSKIALTNAEIIEKTINKDFEVFFGYNEMNLVMRILKQLPVEDIKQNFAEDCSIEFTIREKEAPKTIELFKDLKNITLKLKDEE